MINPQSTLWENVLRALNNGQQPTEAQWQALTPDERELMELLQKERLTEHAVDVLNSMNEDRAWMKLRGSMPRSLSARIINIRWLKYAAVMAGLLMLGATAFLLSRKSSSPQRIVEGKYSTQPVNPKQAMLVLADGRRIELNKNPDSKIQQGQTEIINIDTALLKYSAVAATAKPAEFNTLIVPRGGKYKIQLADGSEIWLNAESKLRYPVHFGGVSKREVFLQSGEAYFKVAHNAALPFVVNANGMAVQVLGTEFNVNTYTNNYATTLVQGSVQLSASTGGSILQPGEQSVFTEGKFTNRVVDVATYTAWKDGQIIFEETPLEEVMNCLGRQYDLTFRFTTPQLKALKFGGRLRRTDHIEDVLTIIEKAGYVTFSLQGKTILVSPAISK